MLRRRGRMLAGTMKIARAAFVVALVAFALGAASTQAAGRRYHVHGLLPDRHCTPGAVFGAVTVAQICTPSYSAGVRNVSRATKRRVDHAYGQRPGRAGEVDHLIPLELGGSNSTRNLWPERAPGAHQKDRVENALHLSACDHRLSLRAAQAAIAAYWPKLYASLMKPPPSAKPTPQAGCCDTHQCIPNFDRGTGTIVQCQDGEYSHSGGESGACSGHGGVKQ